MDDRLWVYSAAVAVQALLSLGQILLKIVAGRLVTTGWGVLTDVSQFLHVAVPGVAVGLLYAVVASLWLYVLQNLPINRAFLFVALTFVFVPLMANMLLGEGISFGTIIGGFLIIAGIAIGVLA
ncbi:EamA family transporter [Mesorhizobium sp.]|uniref:EamA family transporter n=1 Tax=Mesorhizobium sp. TaxID=1871066 RepID=UPI0012204304|nr:EamA family transporter [Mesorhizobium sp.]TIS50597.1 MAG: hypothetical protein E5W96_10005 [Mesorhizobium sp.]